MSHVDVKNMKPTTFEDEYFDEYEYYNLTDKYAGEKSFFVSQLFYLTAAEPRLLLLNSVCWSM